MKSAAALCLLLCMPLGAQEHEPPPHAQGIHTSRTTPRVLPLPRGDDVWHFVVYGDRTGGPAEGIQVLAQAVEDTNLLDPDLVMTVGDLVQGYNTREPWLDQAAEFRRTMDKLGMPWFPVAGNHDVYWQGPGRPPGEHEGDYETHFGPLWYWFRHKHAAFIVLYSDEGDPKDGSKGLTQGRHQTMGPEQLAWLRGALQETQALEHVFVFLHHPRWITDRYPGQNWDTVHAMLAAAGNVKAVFAGHIHQNRYDGVRDGIEYFALGTTGGRFETELPRAGWLHHLDVVTVRKDRLSVATIPVGALIDPRTITAERLADVDALLESGVLACEGGADLEADGALSGHVTLLISNPTTRPIEFTTSITGGPGDITSAPDHGHGKLLPGAQARLVFELARGANGLQAFDRFPDLNVVLEYLAPDVRIALPARRLDVPVRLASLPDLAGDHGVLQLDGHDDCLAVPADACVVPEGPFTLEGWVRPRSLAGRRPFLAKSESSEYCIFLSDGKPSFSAHLDGRYRTAESASTIETGTWHHVAGVYDGSEVRLYVDGRLAGRAPASGSRSRNDLPLYVGADPNRSGRPVDHLQGEVDEVRISTGARYDGERFAPRTRMAPDAATLLLLHLDSDVGPFAVDAGPAGAHARRLGGASSRTDLEAPGHPR